MVFLEPVQQPILVGLFHSGGWTDTQGYYESCMKVKALFDKLGTKTPRTIHLEIHQELLDRMKEIMAGRKIKEMNLRRKRDPKHEPAYLKIGKFTVNTADPFEMVVALADKKGWPVKTLDKQVLRDLPGSTRNVLNQNRRADVEDYFQYNYRERYWGHLVRLRKIPPQDLIIAHPNHITGFAHEAGYSPDRAIWINNPRQGLNRLSPKQAGAIRRLVTIRKRGPHPKLIRF